MASGPSSVSSSPWWCRPWMLGPLTLLIAGASLSSKHTSPQTLILYGDTRGFLSPCGCTQPMSGGIRRAASEIRRLSASGEAPLLINGALVDDTGRQSELKAETFAECFRSLKADAIHVTSADAALGPGTLLSMAQLSDRRLLSSSVAQTPSLDISQIIVAPPFVVGGISTSARTAAALATAPITQDRAVSNLLTASREQQLLPVLLIEGGEQAARTLASNYPDLRLIVYRSSGDPPPTPIAVGGTSLVTTGFQGKHLIRLVLDAGVVTSYNVVDLGPDVRNDPAVSRIYARYLKRVENEDLLGKLARIRTAKYVGSQSCAPCHSKAFRVWKQSQHSRALRTLETEGHGRDPDCVSCHVVGLQSTAGFRSIAKTPQFANVGCESCHGPAASHVLQPYRNRLGKSTDAACVRCHTVQNSPAFNFAAFWPKIAHR
jgi:predicted CXXCH cytochrome family protein